MVAFGFNMQLKRKKNPKNEEAMVIIYTFFAICAVIGECNVSVGVIAFDLPYHITESFGAA